MRRGRSWAVVAAGPAVRLRCPGPANGLDPTPARPPSKSPRRRPRAGSHPLGGRLEPMPVDARHIGQGPGREADVEAADIEPATVPGLSRRWAGRPGREGAAVASGQEGPRIIHEVLKGQADYVGRLEPSRAA